jgi:hypothetical protein
MVSCMWVAHTRRVVDRDADAPSRPVAAFIFLNWELLITLSDEIDFIRS